MAVVHRLLPLVFSLLGVLSWIVSLCLVLDARGLSLVCFVLWRWWDGLLRILAANTHGARI